MAILIGMDEAGYGPNYGPLQRGVVTEFVRFPSHGDSMLVAACAEAGVTTLFTEDMDSPRKIDTVELVNPFRPIGSSFFGITARNWPPLRLHSILSICILSNCFIVPAPRERRRSRCAMLSLVTNLRRSTSPRPSGSPNFTRTAREAPNFFRDAFQTLTTYVNCFVTSSKLKRLTTTPRDTFEKLTTYDNSRPVRYTGTMGILIGMDEAGYGPNLGPLVVAATAWHVDQPLSELASASGRTPTRPTRPTKLASSATTNPVELDLYHPLRVAVSRTASETHLSIADSKTLYKPGHGLRQLERGVHAVLTALDRQANCWSEAVDLLAADPNGVHQSLCWHNGFNCRLPVDAPSDELLPLSQRFTSACNDTGIRPLIIRARLVFPAEFNELTDRFGSKGAALSHISIALLREVIDSTLEKFLTSNLQPPTSYYVLCDKHGARNRYTALLQHHFPDHWIEPICEGHTESCYEWGPPKLRTHVAFRMQGEKFLPTALASMTAKYLRELSMRAFNEFWCARIPGLRPTAGYPGDAPRFKQTIASLQRELGVDDHSLWRNR